MRREQELLDVLAARAGCSYLSDLHRDEFREDILIAANSIPEDTYPNGAWEDALSYITGGVQPAAPGKARETLADYLAKRRPD